MLSLKHRKKYSTYRIFQIFYTYPCMKSSINNAIHILIILWVMKGKKLHRRERLVCIKLNVLKLRLWFFALLVAVYGGFRALSVPTRKLFYRDARCTVCTMRRRMFYRPASVLTAREVTYTFNVGLRILKKM